MSSFVAVGCLELPRVNKMPRKCTIFWLIVSYLYLSNFFHQFSDSKKYVALGLLILDSSLMKKKRPQMY